MKTRYTVALSILAGVAVGAAAVQALHAQAKPPAYVVAEIDVTNAEPYDREYVPPAAKAITDAGGKYVVRGGRTVAIFGQPPQPRIAVMVFEKTVAEMEVQLGKTQWLACDRYTLADAEITPYIERADRLGLAGLWENRPRVFDWFTRIKARPGFKGISDYPPTDYDDTGRDGLKHWTRIKELIAA